MSHPRASQHLHIIAHSSDKINKLKGLYELKFLTDKTLPINKINGVLHKTVILMNTNCFLNKQAVLHQFYYTLDKCPQLSLNRGFSTYLSYISKQFHNRPMTFSTYILINNSYTYVYTEKVVLYDMATNTIFIAIPFLQVIMASKEINLQKVSLFSKSVYS